MFSRRMVDFRKPHSGARYEVLLDDGTKLETDHLIIAVGHSARDTYQMMLDKGVTIARNLSQLVRELSTSRG